MNINIQMTSSPSSAFVMPPPPGSGLWFVGRSLEYSVKPWAAARMTKISRSLCKSPVPKQVSGLWFHDFLGLSNVTFSGLLSLVLD